MSEHEFKGLKIVLASASPRRQELLKEAGFDFEVCPALGDERAGCKEPASVVQELSLKKAAEVFGRLAEKTLTKDLRNIVVIGADTVVSLDGEILGKPKDAEDACAMLRRLSGREHKVYTGVTLVAVEKGEGASIALSETKGSVLAAKTATFYQCTTVYFKEMTEEQIKAYVATGDPLDKAGAYGIQSGAGEYIEKIDGDYNNVVGFPVESFENELREFIKR